MHNSGPATVYTSGHTSIRWIPQLTSTDQNLTVEHRLDSLHSTSAVGRKISSINSLNVPGQVGRMGKAHAVMPWCACFLQQQQQQVLWLSFAKFLHSIKYQNDSKLIYRRDKNYSHNNTHWLTGLGIWSGSSLRGCGCVMGPANEVPAAANPADWGWVDGGGITRGCE